MSIGILGVTIPLYSDSLGADRMAIGFIVSAYAVAYVAASPLWGKASDRLGRKLALGIGMLMSSMIVPLFTFVSDPKLIVVIQLLQGSAGASFWIVPTALIADVYASRRMGEALGKIAMFQGVGFIVGPLLGGFLVEQLNYPGVFYICSAFAFSTALLVFFRLQEKPRVLNRGVKSSSKMGLKFGVRARRSLAIGYVYTIFSSVFFGVIESQFIVHAGEILGKEYLVGFLLASYFMAETFTQPLAGRLSDIIGRHRTILLAFIMSALGFLTLVFPPSFVSLLIAVVAVGGGVGTLYVAPTALLMDVASPSRRGVISGFQNIAWGVGYFLGPMLGGVAAIYSVSGPYILCIVASAMGCTLSLVHTQSRV